MKRFIVTIAITLALMTGHQIDALGQSRWVKTFGGTGKDKSSCITSTSDGGVLVTGWIDTNEVDFTGMIKGESDIFVIKLDTNGDVLWKKTFGGTFSDLGYSITTSSDDGLLITGSTGSDDGNFTGMNKGASDIFVIKLDKDGEVVWQKMFGGTRNDIGRSIATTSDNRVLITGYTRSNDGDFEGMSKVNEDIFVIKLDEDGNVLWKKTLGGMLDERASYITTTSDSEVLITGTANSLDGDFEGLKKYGGYGCIFIIKLDTNGDILWKKTFDGMNDEEGTSITTTSDNGVLITGYTRSDNDDFKGMNKGFYDIFVINLDKDGNVLWKTTLGGSRGESGYSITTTMDGKLLVTGKTQSNDGDFKGMNKGWDDIFVMKLDKDGTILWTKTFGGSKDERSYSITTTSNGGIHITGDTESDDGDFLRLNSSRGAIFVMKLDSNGNLYPTTSVTDFTSATPSFLVTPNPISTSSTVVFSTGAPTTVRIELLNTLGESISVLHDGFMEPGNHRVPLGASSVSSGVYYLRMISEGSSFTTQVVVVR